MKLDALRERLVAEASDIKLNLGSVLTPEGAPGLTESQIALIALATSYATRSPILIEEVEREVRPILSEAELSAAKTAASLMAMNNIYYRFLHLAEDPEFNSMPARLRMNAIARPGIPKPDFELLCTAVSAIYGCGMCIQSHTKVLLNEGLARQTLQSAVRIASVIHATATALATG